MDNRQNGFLYVGGCREGDPISTYLFLLCVEILGIVIRENKHKKGIFVNNVEHKLSQNVDDPLKLSTMLQKNNNNTPSVSGTSVSSVSAFLRLGDIRLRHIRLSGIRLGLPPSRGHPSRPHPSLDIRLGHIRLGDIRLMGIRLGLPPSRVHPSRGHPSRRHPSRGRPSWRLRRPRRMAQTDIPQMKRHEDVEPIPLSFPSREHPPLPFVSAIRLLQFNSSKYTLASVRVQFICLRLKTRYCKKENKCENKEKTIRIHNNFINRRHTIQ